MIEITKELEGLLMQMKEKVKAKREAICILKKLAQELKNVRADRWASQEERDKAKEAFEIAQQDFLAESDSVRVAAQKVIDEMEKQL